MASKEQELKLKAQARLRLKQAPPSTGEVARQALIKGPAAMADMIATGATVAPQMAYGAAATALGRPDLAPNVEGPVTAVSDFFNDSPHVPSYLRTSELENMTPGQEVLDTALQAASTGVAGRGRALANAAVAGTAGAIGEGVEQVTGSPVAGLAASVLAPGAAGRAIPALNIERRIAQIDNAQRDAVLQRARSIGLAYVPAGRISDFADRPKLLKSVNDANQIVTTRIAKRSLGLPIDAQLNTATLEAIRTQAFNSGYRPLMSLGRNPLTVDPATGQRYFDDELINIRNTYSGSRNTFPNAVPRQLDELIDAYIVNSVDAADVVDKVRQLRKEASKAFNSPATTPEGEQLAFARQALADALENELGRQATNLGNPELVARFQAARRQIAVSHLVGDTMDAGSDAVNPSTLGKLFAKGRHMEGELSDAGAFFSMKYGSKGDNFKDITPHYYKSLAGLTVAGSASAAMGVDPAYVGLIALGGAGAANIGAEGIQSATRKYLQSGLGQSRNRPSYDALGTNPALPAGANAGVSFFNANEEELQ